MRGLLFAVVLAGSAFFACGTFGSDDAESASDAGLDGSAPTPDAGGADVVPPDGAAPEASAPMRSVKCSGNTCTSTVCCMENGNVGACDAGCAPNSTTIAINCDDSSDCTAGKNTCCVLFDPTNAGNVVSIACAANCTDGLRACVQEADDCPPGQSCVPLSTARGGSYFPAFTFYACK